jgi:hypothetical protein
MLLFLCHGQAAARNDGPCSGLPLLKAAISRLPEDQRFPCDPRHVIVIRDIAGFLRDHPEIANRADLRWKAEHAMAFTIGPSWPVFINLSSHRALPDAYDRGLSWVAYMFAGVLAHERVHAEGNLSEAAGLAAELEFDKRFRAKGKLPLEFDLPALQNQCRQALDAEQRADWRDQLHQ